MGIDAEGVDKGFRAVVVGQDDGEAPPAEDPPAKVLGGVDIGVDDESIGEGSPTKLFGVGPPEKCVLAEAMLVKSLKMVAKLVMPKAMPM